MPARLIPAPASRFAGAAALLLLGLAAGRLGPRPPGVPAPAPAAAAEPVPAAAVPEPPPAPPAPGGGAEEAAAALQEALADNQVLRGQLEDLFHWILQNFQGHIPLAGHLLDRLDLPVLDETGVLHPDLERFLRITASEREAVNRALVTAKTAVTVLRQAGLEVEHPDPFRMVARFPPFEEEGARVRDRLFAELDALLGWNRFDRMLLAAQPGLQRDFDHFGLSERRIEFAVVPAPEPGGDRLAIRDEWRVPEPDGSVRVLAREILAADLEDIPPDCRFLLAPPGSFAP